MLINYRNKAQIDLQAGDLILCYYRFDWYNPLRYLSVIIRLFTFQLANHVRLVVEDNGDLYINEASFSIISLPVQSILRWHTKIIVLSPKQPIDDSLSFSKKANQKLGAKYWVMGLVYQAIYRLFGKWWGGEQEDKMFCSQYVAWCYSLDKPYLYSVKELYNSDLFTIKYEEQ